MENSSTSSKWKTDQSPKGPIPTHSTSVQTIPMQTFETATGSVGNQKRKETIDEWYIFGCISRKRTNSRKSSTNEEKEESFSSRLANYEKNSKGKTVKVGTSAHFLTNLTEEDKNIEED